MNNVIILNTIIISIYKRNTNGELAKQKIAQILRRSPITQKEYVKFVEILLKFYLDLVKGLNDGV